MKVDNLTRNLLLKILEEKKLYLEGNIIKVLEANEGDTEFKNYLEVALDKDHENRRKRLEVTKQIQVQNSELTKSQSENIRINSELNLALIEAKKAKENAENDLAILQKKTQNELMSIIVKVALCVIVGVGLISTIMYGISIYTNKDTQLTGSTWSNMIGILLTNCLSIIGTIMGVKYSNDKSSK